MEKDGHPYRMVFTTAVPGIPSPGVSLKSIEVGRRLVAKDALSTMHFLNAARARCSTGRPGFCWLNGVRKTAPGVEPASTMFPNGLQDAQHVLRAFARHQGAPIGEAFEDGLDWDPAFHAELTFDIMRKPKEGAPPGPRSILAVKEYFFTVNFIVISRKFAI
jgi:hypothetical protein